MISKTVPIPSDWLSEDLKMLVLPADFFNKTKSQALSKKCYDRLTTDGRTSAFKSWLEYDVAAYPFPGLSTFMEYLTFRMLSQPSSFIVIKTDTQPEYVRENYHHAKTGYKTKITQEEAKLSKIAALFARHRGICDGQESELSSTEDETTHDDVSTAPLMTQFLMADHVRAQIAAASRLASKVSNNSGDLQCPIPGDNLPGHLTQLIADAEHAVMQHNAYDQNLPEPFDEREESPDDEEVVNVDIPATSIAAQALQAKIQAIEEIPNRTLEQDLLVRPLFSHSTVCTTFA